MKNLQKFSENQLSKKQMNEVRGGNCYECVVNFEGGIQMRGTACGGEAATRSDVAQDLAKMYKGMADSVVC